MKQIYIDNLVFVLFCIFSDKAIVSTLNYSTEVLQRGLEVCRNEINFCTVEKGRENRRTCCFSQCSCWNSCFEKRECCPDISYTTFRFKHSCHSIFYENSEYWKRQSEIPARSYEMVTSCLDGTLCSVNTSLSGEDVLLDDLVVVYTEPDNVIFQNKRCAECNGIHDYKRWRLIASDCMFREDNIPADMSAKEMYQHLLSNCIIYSFPPISLVDIMYQQMCEKQYKDDIIITTCNVTGRWDVFNNTVYEACADEYLNFRLTSFKVVYKNVYCFICNHKEDEKVPPSCLRSLFDRFTTEFVEIMDLQTDFSPLTEAAPSGMCDDNEEYDEIFDVCRAAICPRLNYFLNGICKTPPFAVSSKFQYKFNIMCFPSELIPLSMSLDAITLENLFNRILDVTYTREICRNYKLNSVTAYYHRHSLTLHYFNVEVNAPTVWDINCTQDRLANALQSLAHGIELNFTVTIDPEHEKTINVILVPDNRTQMLDSLERLAPNNKTHFSKILFETNSNGLTTTVIEMPFVCPHFTLDDTEYSRLFNMYNEKEPYMEDTAFVNKYRIVVKTFVNSYVELLDDGLLRTYSICLDQYKLIASKLKPEPTTILSTISLVLSCISITCTLVVFLLFCVAKRLNNGPMVIFGCALFNLFIAQGAFQTGRGWNDKSVFCQAIGIAIHYFWLTSVFSLNAFCYLILREMVYRRIHMCGKDVIFSLLYVYGLPACFVFVNILFTNADTANQIKSGYGASQCHINTVLMKGLLFALPIFATVAFNIVINCMIATKIKHTQTTAFFPDRKYWYAFVFFHLLIVVALTWIVGILKEFVTFQAFDYWFDVFVGGQGIILLLLLVPLTAGKSSQEIRI